MCIIKEWHTKNGGISARFYSCEAEGGVFYFLDMDMCTKTVRIAEESIKNGFKAFLAYCSVYGISYRYAKFIFFHLDSLARK